MIQVTEIVEGQPFAAYFKPEHVVSVRVGNKAQGSVITLTGGVQLKWRLTAAEVIELIDDATATVDYGEKKSAKGK